MKKLLLLLLFYPFIAHAWTLAEIQQGLNSPENGTKMDCASGSGQVSYPFGTNAIRNSTAGTDNVRIGWSPTTNITTAPNGSWRSTGNGAITVYKNINFYYTYAGQSKAAVLPAGTYWGNPNSNWRQTDNDSLINIPSTGLANNMRLTAYPFYWTDLYTGNTLFVDNELKVTITLPNGTNAVFWLHCDR